MTAFLIGLPPRQPFRLRVRGEGTFKDVDVRARWWFEDDLGRPVRSEIMGSRVSTEDGEYLLNEPLFTFLGRIRDFNSSPGVELEQRTERWSWVLAALPEGLRVDGFLGGIRVLTPSHCTFLLGQHGGRRVVVPVLQTQTAASDLGEPTVKVSLSAQEAAAFTKSFFAATTARRLYSVGQGTYLLLSPELLGVMRVARQLAHAPGDVQAEFILRPHAMLRKELGDEMGDVIESVVPDEGFSDRVEAIGPAPKRVLPWIKQPPQQWLPPEELGLRIGESFVPIAPADIPKLQDAVLTAHAEGRASIQFGEQTIPITPDTIDAVNSLVGALRPLVQAGAEQVTQDESSVAPAVLVVTTNYDVVGYQASRRQTGDLQLGELSALLSMPLLRHQYEGIAWMLRHWLEGSPGCLLADDMGLGKTVQALAFLALRKRQRSEHCRILIVAPTGLLSNWIEEHAKWLRDPGLGIPLSAYGSALRELRTTNGTERAVGADILDVGRLSSADWVLTTYEAVRDYQLSFGRIQWDCVVLDEAQRIKHPDAGVSQAVKALQAEFAVALSGTPVENRYADLWSIVDAIQPGRLGSLRDFSRTYEGNVEVAGPQLRRQLVDGSPPVMMRRIKEHILEGLPEKCIVPHRRVMPPRQASVYAGIVERARAPATRRMMLAVIQELRNTSLHPGTTLDDHDWLDDDAFIGGSARLSTTIDVLDATFKNDEKTLVFVESLELQARLVGILQRRYAMRRPPMVINGTIAGPDRLRRVNEFQRAPGFDVMLISPKAGGVGLTLTAATCVIHLSRWWNPAVEDQCTDRAYRLGQSRPVSVHLPMAVHPDLQDHSFDPCLDALINRKRKLSREILAAPTILSADVERLFHQLVDEGQ